MEKTINHMLKHFVLATGFMIIIIFSSAQPKVTEEIKLSLDATGAHYLKWTFLNQTWLRWNQSNPGTTVLGENADHTFDIGLRRTRIQFFGQITDHVFFYTQLGQNNFNFLSQNAGNRKLQVFFHDALGEYKVWRTNDRLKLGAGLTIANGLSRFSQPSVSTIMTMDVPVFAQATVDQTDEFSRKLSVYARGQIGKIDYRFTLSDPFPASTNGVAPVPVNPGSTFSLQGHHPQYQGMLIYNLMDKEPHATPYMTGTYLGRKKVLNIETGFISQKKATWTRETPVADTVFHPMKLWSVAVFYDAPLQTGNGNAVSVYAGYFGYDFGPHYLRYNGIMNPANGSLNSPFPGSHGNAFPMFGTGNVFYGQAGYLFGRDLLGDSGTLMPYASLMSAGYDRLGDQMRVYDLGVNWLIAGHNAKLSLDYQNRPVYRNEDGNLLLSKRKGQLVMQYQVFF